MTCLYKFIVGVPELSGLITFIWNPTTKKSVMTPFSVSCEHRSYYTGPLRYWMNGHLHWKSDSSNPSLKFRMTRTKNCFSPHSWTLSFYPRFPKVSNCWTTFTSRVRKIGIPLQYQTLTMLAMLLLAMFPRFITAILPLTGQALG